MVESNESRSFWAAWSLRRWLFLLDLDLGAVLVAFEMPDLAAPPALAETPVREVDLEVWRDFVVGFIMGAVDV